MITSALYALWWSRLDGFELIGGLIVVFPCTAFVVVPLHLHLQHPKDSSALAAFATWFLSAPLACAWLAVVEYLGRAIPA